MDNSGLGNRMKNFENINRNYLIPKIPVVIRLDGKSFSSFTKNCDRPFDQDIIDCMVKSAIKVAEEVQGFKFGYIQSDEVNLLIVDTDAIETQPWFGYNINKMVSISASVMTYWFNNMWQFYCDMKNSMEWHKENFVDIQPAYFDSRVFNMPREECENLIYWRYKDWCRNSLSMYARSFFSHKQLHQKSQQDMHEMLHGIGKNWATDLTLQQKNGTFIFRGENGIETTSEIDVTYDKLFEFLKKLGV